MKNINTKIPKARSEVRRLPDGRELELTDSHIPTADLLAVLTKDERSFVESYCGSAAPSLAAAVIDAGLCRPDEVGVAPLIGLDLISRPGVRQLLRRREQILDFERDGILNPRELQKFWSDVVQDDDEDMPNRLSAARSLADSHGMNVKQHKVQQQTKQDTTIRIVWSGPNDPVSNDQDVIDLDHGSLQIEHTGEESDPLLDDIIL